MSAPEQPTIVVLTALPLEYEAVRAHLDRLRTIEHDTGTRAQIGPLAETPWQVALVQMGEGAVNAAVLTERAINWLKPQAVVFVGVAGSLKKKKVKLGDVVFATKVYAYHGGRETKKGFKVRPDSWRASQRLDQAARHTLGTRAHFKPIAAGDVLLDDDLSAVARHLEDHYEDAAAIEMEGNGVAHAAHLSDRVDAAIIRGISDLANGRKAKADASGSQLRAAANAAEAAFAVIRALSPRPGTADTAQAGDANTYGGDHIDLRHNINNAPVIGKIVYQNPRQRD
ncbi:5'-methylthioadenosine/S-adenosylhomocysteine nucleosidase [Streptomyces acidiscabies]|uniref:5'-methylthioadenosine/S-adenosylhomocysteine nucleosidase n=1 Tax=Streptomyces acidiscabies TaxID=42234 RepID=UPI0009592DD5|nr:5'-methylthioadenosine/S-adenosylhomocysteine nucleosidase [Streptomyces acidiscabies]GAV43382.1 5'-methylthioadenosine/S-adenosylhomocysteine [Streptomyces acidiscabies]